MKSNAVLKYVQWVSLSIAFVCGLLPQTGRALNTSLIQSHANNCGSNPFQLYISKYTVTNFATACSGTLPMPDSTSITVCVKCTIGASVYGQTWNDVLDTGGPTNLSTTGSPAPADFSAECPGCVIRIDNRSVGESVGIVGTPWTLSYSTDRVQGRAGDYRIHIPINFVTHPVPGYTGSAVTVNFAGRTDNYTIGVDPSTGLSTAQTMDFNWDGLDSTSTVTLGSTTAALQRTMGYGVPILVESSNLVIGSYKAVLAGLGGWTISAHHFLDKGRKQVYKGGRRLPEGTRLGLQWYSADLLLHPFRRQIRGLAVSPEWKALPHTRSAHGQHPSSVCLRRQWKALDHHRCLLKRDNDPARWLRGPDRNPSAARSGDGAGSRLKWLP